MNKSRLIQWVCLYDGRTAPAEVKDPACPKCGRKMTPFRDGGAKEAVEA